jgi:hypothetical protein
LGRFGFLFRRNSTLSDKLLARVSVDGNDIKWFGTGGMGASQFDGTNWTVYSTSNSGLLSNTVLAPAFGLDGAKWFGGDGVSVLYGTFFINDNAQWLSSTQYSASYNITSATPKGDYRVSVNDAFDSNGMRIAPISNAAFTVDYAGSITDKTPPLKPVVTATGNGDLTTLSANWTSSDPESSITKYRYAIGTTPGERDVVDWIYIDNSSITHTGLNLTAGVTYYISAGARNEGGLWSESGVSNGILAGVTPPGSFGKSNPADNAINQPINPTLEWTTSANVTQYEYCLDAETVNNGICDSSWESVSATSATLSNLKANKKYFWQVRAVNNGGVDNADTGTWWNFTTQLLTKTISSTAIQDGWILESGEKTSKGGTMNSTATTLNLGDDVSKKQYLGILSFSTGAGLPDDAVITKVTLKVKKSGVIGGGNPVTMFQGFMLDIKKGFFGTAALQITDFQAAANKTYGPFMTALSGGWYNIDLTSGKAYINKLSTLSGLTQLRLRFSLDDNNNAVANYLSLFSGNAPAASRPQLIIEYYVP